VGRVPRLLLAAVLALTLAAAGCGSSDDGDGDGGGGSATVVKPGEAISMKSLAFHPDHAQVKVGQQVVWHNDESIPHDVKADSGAGFASKTFGKGGTFSWTAAKAGTVKYECTLHPGMDGTLVVVAP
jgi:plastocyanin